MVEAGGLRLLADDLTGALDCAAAFASPEAPIPVRWRLDAPLPSIGALDVATREASAATAVARHRGLADWLGGGRPAFKKIDSLMRGHWALEIAALAAALPSRRFVLAPAFPFQDRVTRGGRQWHGGAGEPIGGDIRETLTAAGMEQSRIEVCDAESDADLDAMVRAEASRDDAVIWVGTGGLAAALARAGSPLTAGASASLHDALRGPLLALIGSNHPVMLAQIAAAEAALPACHIRLDGSGQAEDRVWRRLLERAPVLVTVAFDGDREEAARVIARRFARLLADCRRPGTLLVSGGETLRDVAGVLGADGLNVEGALEPGLPVSRLRGGRFHDVPVISKSGAFGRRDLLSALVAATLALNDD